MWNKFLCFINKHDGILTFPCKDSLEFVITCQYCKKQMGTSFDEAILLQRKL